MDQERPLKRKKKKVKGSTFLPAGSLASLANQMSLMGTKRNVQLPQPGSQVPLDSTSSVEQVREQLQQVPRNSPSPTQVVLQQVQQTSLHSTPSTAQAVQEQVQQMSQDSTAQEENEQSEEGGRTQMQSVHGRSERKLIVLNKYNQPVGPTPAVVAELGSFLGTLARNSTFCPVNVLDWRKLKTHKDMWSYTKEKYDIPDTASKWAFKEISKLGEVSPTQLLQETSRTNTENRKKLRYPHTVGKRSFAIIREAEMERIETQESEDGSQSVDAFASVMGPEHPGCVRLYGRGVTKTDLKEKMGNSGPSLNITDEMMQQKIEEIEARVQQRMQKKFDAQMDTMERDVTMKVVGQIQHLNPNLQLDPSLLRFSVCSHGEAAIQQINRPSAGSNNQVKE
ncbi:uncharacterized protein LOC132639324 [Lycium barbarum]|uniref:uncharacterized protein LOC132639324 n=1 Tax=Lycium barbarum TaxID=112863 RepID=UPI00293EC7DA|nr:uncharacterized protein LOC132639324 [Lycium barbarum]